ncbi:FecR domain-containing protein [Lacipirellula sp.]|uniref:FecR domain-containing protein n=1 Tax=Lacipirellula sp. TaxID=2691419 RepID=UPI003D0FC85F
MLNIDDSRLLAIYSSFLDGRELNEAEASALRVWIAESESNASRLVEFAILHSTIADRLMMRRLLDDLAANRRAAMIMPAMLAEAIEDIEASSPRVTPLVKEELPEPAALRPWQYLSVPVAAILLVAALGVWSTFRASETTVPQAIVVAEQPSTAVMPTPAQPVLPKVVGRLGASFDAIMANREPLRPRSELIEGERLRLLGGVLQLNMASGAVLVIEAPSDVTLDGEAAISLAQGKVAVRIDGSASSFIVDTPTSKVVDLGTEFGVESNPAEQDRVMVFDGCIALVEPAILKPEAAIAAARDVGTLQVAAGYEVSLSDAKQSNAAAKVQSLTNERYFVRPDEITVRQRALTGSEYDLRLAEHYERLRINGLVAYQPFDPASYGREFSIGIAPHGVTSAANLLFTGDTGGGCIEVSGGPAFLPLDTSAAGPFGRAGLVKPNGLVGQSENDLWLTWTTQRLAADPESTGSAGVSLMFGERSDFDEPIFIGRGFGALEQFSVQSAWGGALPPDGARIDTLLDSNTEMAGVQAKLSDARKHRWLARIEFREGADRVSVWIDRDLASIDPNAPHARIEDVDIEFDRLRFAVNREAEVWRFSNFAAATNLRALQNLTNVGKFHIDH